MAGAGQRGRPGGMIAGGVPHRPTDRRSPQRAASGIRSGNGIAACGCRRRPTLSAVDFLADRREPAVPLVASSPPASSVRPRSREAGWIGSAEAAVRADRFADPASACRLLLLLDWPMHPPAEVTPIPVQLVFQPPPPPPPKHRNRRRRPKLKRGNAAAARASRLRGYGRNQDQGAGSGEERGTHPLTRNRRRQRESRLEAPPKIASIDPPLLPAPAEIELAGPPDWISVGAKAAA